MPGPVGANPTPGHDVESTTRQGSGCLGLALFRTLRTVVGGQGELQYLSDTGCHVRRLPVTWIS